MLDQGQQPLLTRVSDRRAFLKRAAVLGMAVPGAGALLAACGGGSDDSPAPTTEAPAGGASETPAGDSETGSSATPDASGEATADGGTVNLVMNSSPDTFIPHYSLGAYSRYLGNLMFLRLLRYRDDTTLAPYLAESYEVSDDGTTYTFTLASDATWTDGTPVTARDVAWTYTVAFDKDYAGTRQVEAPILGAEAYREGSADAIEGIEVVDDHTLRITLEYPSASFLENVAQFFWILPAHVLEDTPVAQLDKHDLARTPSVTAGPLKFVRYETDQYVEFVRNDDFILGRPKIEKFIIKILKADVALAQFQKGELDATTNVGTMLPQDVAKLETLDVEVVPVPGSSVQVMGINNALPYFQDARVRQAMVHAIDREAIIESLLGGYGLVMNAKVPPFSPYYNPEVEGMLPYDPARARQLLEEAGWDFGREVTLIVPTGIVTRERSGPIIQQFLQAVGMQVKLETMDFASMRTRIDEGDVELWLVGSSYVTFDPDETSSFHSESVPPKGWNSWRWSNPEADRALEDGLAATTVEERKEAYDRLQVIMAEDVPVVFLYYPEEIHVVSRRLQNATPVPVGIEWNIHEWSLAE